MAAQWGGRSWAPSTPAPWAARLFTDLAASHGRRESMAALEDLLVVLLDDRQRDELDDGLTDGTLPADLDKLIDVLVVAGSGRPLQAVVSLAVTCVRSWSVIRGHCIRSGIGDPLRNLPTLWALLDLAESLIMEGKDEKERDAYLRKMYPPTSAAGARGWTEADEAASFEAFTAGMV